MIGWLRGNILEKNLESVLVDCHGVGYDVHVSVNYLTDLLVGSDATFYIYTHVREEALQLFGFKTKEEKQLFLMLLSVSGVGAKTAMNMLGLTSVHELIQAIVRKNVAFIKSCPGVGQKTAERVILDLATKLQKWDFHVSAAKIPNPIRGAVGDMQEAVSALVNLGYRKAEAEHAVGTLDFSKHQTFDSIFRESLRTLRNGN